MTAKPMSRVASLFLLCLLVFIFSATRYTKAHAARLSDLVDQNLEFQVLDKVFSDWQIVENTAGFAPENFVVTGLDDQPLNPGISIYYLPSVPPFTGSLSTSGILFESIELSYKVTSLGNPIKDASLGIHSYHDGIGSSTHLDKLILNDIYYLEAFDQQIHISQPANGFNAHEDSVLFSDTPLLPDLTDQLTVVASIGVGLNGYSDTIVTLSQIDARHRYSQTPIPIPGTFFLFGSGLIGLAGIRKKFKK